MTEQINSTGTAEPDSTRRDSYSAIAGSAALLILCFLTFALAAAQEAKPAGPADSTVRLSIHNVKYRFAENVSVQINNLTGAIVPVGDHKAPVLDDKESFKVRIESAEVAMSLQDVANMMNQFVFGRPGSQLSGISVMTTEKGNLKVKGRLKDKGDIPFETEGALVPTSDGKLRLHAQEMKALKIPVKGLMDSFGIEVDNLIKSGKVPGVTASENDVTFDIEQVLPAPHVEGKVTKIRVEPNMIVQTLAGDAKIANDAKAMPKYPGNYIAFEGDRVKFGKVTFEDSDIVLFDMNPVDPFDFFLDHYREQLAAGYMKASANFQVRAYLKDYGKLASSKTKATTNSNN